LSSKFSTLISGFSFLDVSNSSAGVISPLKLSFFVEHANYNSKTISFPIPAAISLASMISGSRSYFIYINNSFF
jgi:hypothetical protein